MRTGSVLGGICVNANSILGAPFLATPTVFFFLTFFVSLELTHSHLSLQQLFSKMASRTRSGQRQQAQRG